MSDTELAETIDKHRVQELTSRFSEPEWLADNRLAAWEAYLQMPMPSGREDAWRRVDLSVLDLTRLKAFDLGPAREIEKAPAFPKWYETAIGSFGATAGVLFQTTKNGGYLQLDKDLVDRGVIFCDLATAIEKHPGLIQQYLTQTHASEKFELMTRALFNCGAFLYIPKNVEVEAPFIFGLAFSANGEPGQGGAIFPRLIAVADENSKARVVHLMGPESDESAEFEPRPVSLASELSELHIKRGSKVSYLELQQFSSDVFMVQELRSHVANDADFTSLSVAMGGKQTKSTIATYLDAPGANSCVLGAVLGNGHESFSFDTIQEHNAPDTTSNINFRVALKDSSTSVYQGSIRVAKAAQRTDAYQQNKNLLLGSEARADSIPRLEILADDVKCSHGATVGPVDRDQVFYLMSRGISHVEAEQLIVLGFFRKVLEQFPMPNAMEWLTDMVSAKIARNA